MTTAQMLRAVENLRELVEAKFDGSESVISERFKAVDQRFSLAEAQRVEQKIDTQTAVAAALSAQKEAVAEQTNASSLSIAKSEAATSKQLDALAATSATAINGVTVALNDLKDRIGRIENIRQGGRDAVGAIYAFAGFLLTLLVIGGLFVASGGGR